MRDGCVMMMVVVLVRTVSLAQQGVNADAVECVCLVDDCRRWL
jgi:hypothetical protein